jgi:hypothetical protein
MKIFPRRSFPFPVGLVVLAVAACIDVSALKRPAGSGGVSASAGQGGMLGGAGAGGGEPDRPGSGAPDAPRAGISLGVVEIDGSWQAGNFAGVRGGWWSTGDLYGTDNVPGTGTCPMAGFSPQLCSVLTTPTPGTPFRPSPQGMCTTGIAARVLNGNDGQPAWSAIWGNMIGFTLASDFRPDAGVDSWGTYDAPAHGFGGLMFDIDGVPAGVDGRGHMRVSFLTKGTEYSPAFWQGAGNDLSPISSPWHYEIPWSEVGGPSYRADPPPFDPTTLEAIRFDVVSNAVGPISYSFCISNLAFFRN